MKTTLLSRLLMICFLVMLFFTSKINLYAQGSGYALEFDGIDDYVTVTSDSADELNPTNAVTVESWIYLSEPASATHRPHYLGKSYSYQLVIDTTAFPRFFVRQGGNWYGTTGTTLIETGKWYHIAGTFDGTDIRIFVNGKLEGTPTAVTPPLEQNPSDVRFGDRFGGLEALSGKMDEVRIWDSARTETEIQNGMNMKLVGNESNLLGYWRLDDSSGTTVSDLTVNGNDGSLVNMDALSDWITSTSPIGDESIFAESADIAETSICELDVVFGTGLDAPGTGYSLAAIQIDENPDDSSGLEYNVADKYWEIWSEDMDFDGDFTATIQFHYDNISGINDESILVLYRRDSVSSASWSSVSGYTVVSDDGASSTPVDGVGYIQLDITEATQGGFGGQYIIGWNIPPVANVDNDTTTEDTLVVIDVLDNDTDTDGSLDNSTVTISGDPTNGTITNINTSTGEVTYTPNSNYVGSDQFSYTVDDDGGATSNSAIVTVIINSINDSPVVTDIPGQTIAEDETFSTIILDDYVSDIEDTVSDISWTWSGNTDLTVDIDSNRIATISIPGENWYGGEIITFTATDNEGGFDSDTATFTVTSVNDLPVVTDIPDQTIVEGESFMTINLDDYVSDVEDSVADILWDWSGNTDLTVTIDANRIATIGIPNADWNGNETITFTAIDLDGGEGNDSAIFTVTADNDPPVMTDIPDQTVSEGENFSIISLDDYVTDIEDADGDIVWSWSGNTDLTVSVDVNRIATISIPDENWNGNETIIFTATDLDGANASDSSTFTVTHINDAPIVLNHIPDTSGVTLEEFVFQFDISTFVDVDPGDSLMYSASLTTGDLPAWLSFDGASRTFSGTPDSEDIGVYNVVVEASDMDMESVADTFEIQILKGPLGIKDLTQEWKLNVYPNPSDGNFFVNMSLPENEDIEMKIFNTSGQLVQNEKYLHQFGNVRLMVNLNDHKKGIYIIRIISRSGVANKQILVH